MPCHPLSPTPTPLPSTPNPKPRRPPTHPPTPPQAQDHWIQCASCHKWRGCKYPDFAAMRVLSRFTCKLLPRKACAQACDYCSTEPCKC